MNSGKIATINASLRTGIVFVAIVGVGGCGDGEQGSAEGAEASVAPRAYVVSEESDELFVADLSTMSEVGKVDTHVGEGRNANHMAILSRDGTKVYVSATEKDAVVVIDALQMKVTDVIPVGPHNTHMNTCVACGPGGGDELWVVNEGGDHSEGESGHEEGSIAVIDMSSDEVVQTILHDSLVVPHFVRFSGNSAYIPNIGGNQITIVDRSSYEVSDVLLLEGEEEAGACSGDPCGFADAQIDSSGVLMAAHIQTGRVLVYDTLSNLRKSDITMGSQPWAVFVDEFSNGFGTHLMPNWGDSTVSILDPIGAKELARSRQGDRESFGVNFSPLAPGQAFVLNRIKEQVAIIDRETGEPFGTIDVGGTTETGSTTADGKYLLLPVSSTNEFRVFDVVTREEVARFENVGTYPWSVATPGGQNYCH